MSDLTQKELWRMLADLRFEMLQSRIAATTDTRELCRNNTQMFSQGPEDGVIAEIFRRIGVRDKTFIEIGVGNGRENTTRLLLTLGWSGVWVEGNAENAAAIRRDFAAQLGSGQLKLVESMVTTDNISPLLNKADAPLAFDYLSVDVDMNTYYIWQAMRDFRPRVAAIEYNASIPAPYKFVVPYRADAIWDGSNWYGASLKSLELLGAELGLSLVGCDAFGLNGFFVRSSEDLARFMGPYTAEQHYRAASYLAPMRWGHWPAKPETTRG
ncbi:MAG: hypothetical protein SGJ17_07825 [Hyphomicrobiales bacterium]|nr:hypothetical protein [Hyphomicrobiales bacterium]